MANPYNPNPKQNPQARGNNPQHPQQQTTAKGGKQQKGGGQHQHGQGGKKGDGCC